MSEQTTTTQADGCKRMILMGATSGIGLAVAELLLKKASSDGNTILGLAGRNIRQCEYLAQKYPGRVFLKRIDITDTDATDRLRELVQDMGGLDCYFHISGIGYDNPSLDTDRETATDRVNVEGFTRMISCVYNIYKEWNAAYKGFAPTSPTYHPAGGKFSIAAVTSIAGTRGIGTMASYCASKRYQQTYLEAIAQLSRRDRLPLDVTDIRPGWISTPLLRKGAHYAFLQPLPKAARRIVRALHRAPAVAVIGAPWYIVLPIWKMLPGWLWRRLRIAPGS